MLSLTLVKLVPCVTHLTRSVNDELNILTRKRKKVELLTFYIIVSAKQVPGPIPRCVINAIQLLCTLANHVREYI